MSGGKFSAFFKRNLVAITMIPSIIRKFYKCDEIGGDA